MGNTCSGGVHDPPVVLDRRSVQRLSEACCDGQLLCPPAQAALISRRSSQVLTNQRVGDVYEFGRTLGTGGFSAVKLVTHKTTREKYACKIMMLPRPGTAFDDVREDILNEINILIGLEHPNVVHLKECFFAGRPNLVRHSLHNLFPDPFGSTDEKVDGEKVYLVMELLQGGELLDAIIDKGSYTEDDARAIFRQIACGLCYLHSKGIIHRDLKLDNLLLVHPGNISHVKIADFGLARSAAAAGDAVAAAGTPHYVAPEVVESAMQGGNVRALSPACDLWSLGICLFILLGGYPPFDDTSEARLLEKIRRGKFTFQGKVWGSVSNGAKDLIRHLLVLDPTQRLTIKQVLEHPWLGVEAAALAADAAHGGVCLCINAQRVPGPHLPSRPTHPPASLLSQLLEGLEEVPQQQEE